MIHEKNQEELLEDLHRGNDNRVQELNKSIDTIASQGMLMMKIISRCASAPHVIIRGIGEPTGYGPCSPNCPACIATRFLSNSLTEEDLKLLGVKS